MIGDFNITFFIQIFNFLISWFILDRFLFKPCVEQVTFEDQEKMHKQASVCKTQADLHVVKTEKNKVFLNIRTTFAQTLPKTISINTKIISTHSFIHVQECDLATQKNMQHAIVKQLVKRITNV